MDCIQINDIPIIVVLTFTAFGLALFAASAFGKKGGQFTRSEAQLAKDYGKGWEKGWIIYIAIVVILGVIIKLIFH